MTTRSAPDRMRLKATAMSDQSFHLEQFARAYKSFNEFAASGRIDDAIELMPGEIRDDVKIRLAPLNIRRGR